MCRKVRLIFGVFCKMPLKMTALGGLYLLCDLIGKFPNRIINKVNGIFRMVYDMNNELPAAIEWE